MTFLEVQIKILRQCDEIGVVLILRIVNDQLAMFQRLRLHGEGQ